MPYITPVTNHTASDYFNVADFSRIYNNARLTHDLAEIMIDDAITFTPVTAPTTATNPPSLLSMVNALCVNIENVRLAMVALLPLLTTIKDDWIAGANNPAPNYSHVNQWETTIDAIWDYWNGDSIPVCPSLTADLAINTQYIVVDCIDTNGHTITINAGGSLHII